MARKQSGRKTAPSGGSLAIMGVSNFVGVRLAETLAEDKRFRKQVIALDSSKPAFSSERIKFLKIDLTQPTADSAIADALRDSGCDTVVHLSFFGQPTRDESYAHELEVIGTMHVLNACAQTGVKKIIIASTTSVYGASPRNPNFLTEDHPLNGNKNYRYIRDRVEVENLARRFREAHPEITVTVLRFAMILGPTVQNLATQYFRRLFVPTLLGYDPLVQFLHEDDAVRAFRLAIDKNCSNAYNIVGKGVLPLSTVISLMGKFNLPLVHAVAYPVISALWLVNAADAPGQHLDYIRYLWVADGEKAKRELGFEARYSTKEAAMGFAGAERLRKIHL
ncbi:MAG: NAD-dependent epimerase/dehydratase family protein [Candidatus Lindowbacteria bacterium]|nr:NAD-dependent epimerase/dehydratase family protein [Candidatus Lindowbacteria bacterium]